MTSTVILQLVQEGTLKLDDPITRYAPELANLKELTWDNDGKLVTAPDGTPVLRSPVKPATMRQLMSHTAGFGYGLSGNDPANTAFRDERVLGSQNLDEMMKKIAGIPLLYEPGTKWSYSVAVDIQGYLVQKLSGQKFGDYLRDHVTGPIGMTDTAFYVTPDRTARFTAVYHWARDQNKLVMHPARSDRGGFEDPTRLESGGGGLVASTHDYARFCQMLLNKGELDGVRLLSARTVDTMTANGLSDEQQKARGGSMGWGLANVNVLLSSAPDDAASRGEYGWDGTAGTIFWIDPVKETVIVLMTQSSPANPDRISQRFKAIVQQAIE